MADDADAYDRTLNGTTDVRARSETQPSESAEASTEREFDAVPAEMTAVDGDRDTDDRDERVVRRATPVLRLALVLGLAAVLVLSTLGGWLGYGIYDVRQADNLRNRFLAAGKQGALNLTTINYTEADADVQRILESSTGQFRDEFSKRAPAFVDVVKQAQSKTQGSITEAGVESITGDAARVIVAVAVNTTGAGAPDQPTRHWRMHIDLKKVGDTVKVSNVGFVP